MLVVVTDGKATKLPIFPIDAPSAALKAANVMIYTIGVGNNVDSDELKLISSDPDNKFVWESADFSFLNSIRSQVASQVCTGSPTVFPCQSVPCQNNGVCVDSSDLSSYTCVCKSGYKVVLVKCQIQGAGKQKSE